MNKKIGAAISSFFFSLANYAQEVFVIILNDMPALNKDAEVRVYENHWKIKSSEVGDFGFKDFSMLKEGVQANMDFYNRPHSFSYKCQYACNL